MKKTRILTAICLSRYLDQGYFTESIYPEKRIHEQESNTEREKKT